MMVSRTLAWDGVATLALLGLLALGCERSPGRVERPETKPVPDPLPNLERHRPVRREIVADERHSYVLDLQAGDYVELVVDQQGADLTTALVGPDSKPIMDIDRRIDRYGPEPLIALAQETGRHLVEVRAFATDEPFGRYRLVLEELRPASATDRTRARAVEAFAAGESARRRKDYGSAHEQYRFALKLFEELDDAFWQAETLDRRGYVSALEGRWEEALDFHLESARLFAGVRDRRSESLALYGVAKARFSLRKIPQARADFERALELRPEGDRNERGVLLVSLAQADQALGENAEAVARYDEARRLLQGEVDSATKAQILHQLGYLYRTLGEAERSLDYLNEAAAMWLRLGERNRRAASIHQRGRLLLQLGRIDEASRDHAEALELRRATGHLQGQVAALTSLGEMAQRRGDRDSAIARFREALEVVRSEALEAPQAEARLLLNLGATSGAPGDLSYYRKSRDLYRSVGDTAGEAEALLGIARSERSAGRARAARESVASALDLVESLRPTLVSDEVSQSYFATVQRYFDLYIELSMELDAVEPDKGHAESALAAVERARARSLLDLLSLLDESVGDLHAGASLGLIEREGRLQRELNAAERWRLGLLRDPKSTEEERAYAAKSVRRLLDELGRLRAQIRRDNPHYAALTQPEPLELDGIQKLVLDDRTLLLEYWLGDERSFLFLVSRDSLRVFDLPGREAVEVKAVRAYEALARSHRPEARRVAQEALCELSRVLLEPVADELGDQRLLIVADGALQYLPFSALADPRELDRCPDARPLLLANETTYLSSASVLAVLRSETAERPRPSRGVAVVADPVFSSEDSRVSTGTAVAALATRPSESIPVTRGPAPPGGFERLPLSRREAEGILSLAPRSESFLALDFDARKQLVLDGTLEDFRIVHLATHAVIDSARPAFSGIVFSMVDASGAAQDGFLRAHELYNVRLGADLVVLSACRTALGKAVRGEGMVGLTRAFAYAGAKRLIVGLWNVEDRGTAELMQRFYRELLVGGSPPAAALRAAQISLRSENLAPYYWAGFIHQGEYK